MPRLAAFSTYKNALLRYWPAARYVTPHLQGAHLLCSRFFVSRCFAVRATRESPRLPAIMAAAAAEGCGQSSFG